MGSHIRRTWEQLRSSLWFIPSLMVLAATLLAFCMVALDRAIGSKVSLTFPLVFEAGPDGAREVLGTIAGSVLAVAGVAFSFTILAFSLASSQYSPRILYNFMDDRANQTVLGLLLSSFVYCLLVLRTVRTVSTVSTVSTDGNPLVDSTFVPSISVTVALGLVLLDLGLFIFYLHHVSVSVTAYHIINRVGHSAASTAERIFQEDPDQKSVRPAVTGPLELTVERFEMTMGTKPVEVRAKEVGYLLEVDKDSLITLTQQHDLYLEVIPQVGDYISVGKLLAKVGPRGPLPDDVPDAIVGTFTLDRRRSQEHDALFTMMQLSDVAVKALSPGINDPTTAIMCLEQIERVLSVAGKGQDPPHAYRDQEGAIRVVIPTVNFRSMVNQALNQVRHYGAGDAAVTCKLLEVVVAVSEQISDSDRCLLLREHARAVVDAADCMIKIQADRVLVDETIQALSADPQIAAWELRGLS